MAFCLLSVIHKQCVVPENIQTSTTEGIGNSRGMGGSEAQEIPEGVGGSLSHLWKFRRGGGAISSLQKWKIQGGGGVLSEIPSVVGVWIFSGTTQ